MHPNLHKSKCYIAAFTWNTMRLHMWSKSDTPTGAVVHAPAYSYHHRHHHRLGKEQVMVAREIPTEWRVLMDRKGLSSVRQLAMRAGVSHVTVNRLVFGDPFFATEETIQSVADALGVPYSTVYQLAGRRVKDAEPWSPPAEAARLTLEQRKVLDQLIRTMAGQQPLTVIDHPERDGVDLAADTSHGPAQSQRADD